MFKYPGELLNSLTRKYPWEKSKSISSSNYELNSMAASALQPWFVISLGERQKLNLILNAHALRPSERRIKRVK